MRKRILVGVLLCLTIGGCGKKDVEVIPMPEQGIVEQETVEETEEQVTIEESVEENNISAEEVSDAIIEALMLSNSNEDIFKYHDTVKVAKDYYEDGVHKVTETYYSPNFTYVTDESSQVYKTKDVIVSKRDDYDGPVVSIKIDEEKWKSLTEEVTIFEDNYDDFTASWIDDNEVKLVSEDTELIYTIDPETFEIHKIEKGQDSWSFSYDVSKQDKGIQSAIDKVLNSASYVTCTVSTMDNGVLTFFIPKGCVINPIFKDSRILFDAKANCYYQFNAITEDIEFIEMEF